MVKWLRQDALTEAVGKPDNSICGLKESTILKLMFLLAPIPVLVKSRYIAYQNDAMHTVCVYHTIMSYLAIHGLYT